VVTALALRATRQEALMATSLLVNALIASTPKRWC